MLGIKQETLALNLGDEWNQKKISLIEHREVIEDCLLEKIAEVLQIPAEAFRIFDEEHAVNIITGIFTHWDSTTGGSAGISSGVISHYHPLDKLIELHDQKIVLYERMLKEKDDVISRLEAFLKNK